MRRDRGTDPEPEDRRGNQDNDNAEADDHVLADDRAGATAEADRERQMREIVAP